MPYGRFQNDVAEERGVPIRKACDAPVRFSIFFALFFLTGLFFCLRPADLRAEESAVIPPGKETLFLENLEPPGGMLPEDARFIGISIQPRGVDIRFERAGQALDSFRLQQAGSEAGSWNCRGTGGLELCFPMSRGDTSAWPEIYRNWVLDPERVKRLSGGWTATEKPRAADESPRPGRPLAALFLLLALGTALSVRKEKQAARPVFLAWSAICGSGGFAVLFAVSDREISPGWFLAGLAVCWGLGWGLLRRTGLARPDPALSLRIARSALRPFLVAVSVGLLLLAAPEILESETVRAHQDFMRARWLSDSGRALAYNLVFGGGFVAAMASLIRAMRGERLFRPGLRMLSIVGVIAIPALVLLSGNPSEPDLSVVYSEWQAAYGMASNSLPQTAVNTMEMGGQALAAWGFRFFGRTPAAIHAVHWGAFLFCALSLAVLARVLYGRFEAGVAAVLAFVLLPSVRVLLVRGWWFLLVLGCIALALALFWLAAKRKSSGLWLAGILMVLGAVFIRPEGLVLLPMYWIVQALHGFPQPRENRRAAWILSAGLFWIVFIYFSENDAGAGHLSENLTGYATQLVRTWGWILLAALALWRPFARLERITRNDASPPHPGLPGVFWFLGALALYLLAYTVPSPVETLLIQAPLAVMLGGLFSFRLDSAWKDAGVKIGGFVLVILLLFNTSIETRKMLNRQVDRDREHGRRILNLARTLPPEVPLLLPPLFTALAEPSRRALMERPMALDREGLEKLRKHPRAACFNDLDSDDRCCYLEIDLGRGEYDGERCWDHRALGWKTAESRSDGPIRMLILEPESVSADRKSE